MRPALTFLIVIWGLLSSTGARSEIPYEVVVTRTDGQTDSLLSDDPLLSTIRDASELVSLADQIPRTVSILRSRINGDADRLIRVLRAEGYYDGTVEIDVQGLDPEALPQPQDSPDEEQNGTAVTVTIAVTPGPLYTLRSFAIDNAHPYGSPFPVDVDLADIDIALGDPATGRRIVRGQDDLVSLLEDRGRPLAEVVDRLVIADHDAKAVDVTLTVDAGPSATFGALEIDGLEDVDAGLVRRLIEWQEGDPYDQALVDETRGALAQLGVFRSVTIAPAEDWVAADGSLPLRLTVTERDHRTIGGGVSYGTNDGFGGELYWRHRNLFGQAENLELRLAGSQRLSELAAEYRDNSFFEDQRYTLTADAAFGYEQAQAYTNQTIEAATGISYAYDDSITFSGGIRTVVGKVEEDRLADAGDDDGEIFTLIGTPLAFDYDLRDDSFAPTSGTLTRLTLEPLFILSDPNVKAVRLSAYQTGYWAPFDDDSVVLAGWARAGSILGAASDTIPAGERFYVGGGGSVRGFAYQLAGDVDDAGDPLGGQSMFAVGAETRFRFLDDYGAVLFLEGGRTFPDAIPRFKAPLLWGAGVGARYFTDFGPVRLDVAVPLNGRAGVDDGYQIYLSFGQAF